MNPPTTASYSLSRPPKDVDSSDIGEDALLGSVQETMVHDSTITPQPNNTTILTITANSKGEGRPRTDYQQLKSKACRARFILGKIAKNEAEADPRDAEDKKRCQETIA